MKYIAGWAKFWCICNIFGIPDHDSVIRFLKFKMVGKKCYTERFRMTWSVKKFKKKYFRLYRICAQEYDEPKKSWKEKNFFLNFLYILITFDPKKRNKIGQLCTILKYYFSSRSYKIRTLCRCEFNRILVLLHWILFFNF